MWTSRRIGWTSIRGLGRMLEGEEERAIGLDDLIYVPPGAVRGQENTLRKRCPLASQRRHRRWMRRPLTTTNSCGLRNKRRTAGGRQNPEGGYF
jgi:hypothetical protein